MTDEGLLIGWDISTSAIGVCIKLPGGTLLKFHVIFPKGETHLEKHRSATEQIADLMKRLEGEGPFYHFVEDCLAGGFGGMTTRQTLQKLAAMNAVTSHTLSYTGTVTHIPPVSTKRIMGLQLLDGETKKDAVVRMCRAAEPEFPYRLTAEGNWVKGTDDMADAWLLAEAGGRIMRGEAVLRVNGPKTKTQRAVRKARAPKAVKPRKGRARLPVPEAGVLKP